MTQLVRTSMWKVHKEAGARNILSAVLELFCVWKVTLIGNKNKRRTTDTLSSFFTLSRLSPLDC